MGMPSFYPFRSAETRDEYLALYDQWARSWPVAAETRMVKTDHGTTLVRCSGSPDSPPLVLLPGNGATSLMWVPNIACWAAHYRTYALDSIYDFGRSVAARPIKGADDLALWLDSVLAELGLESGVNLLGMSLGGWLAGQYAVRYPRRLSKLVWLSPAGTILPVSWRWLSRMMLILIPHPYFFKQFIYWISPDLRRDAAGQAMVRQMIAEFNLTRRCFRRMPIVAPTVLTDAQLAQIPVPVLYLIGENEKLCAADKAVARLQRVAPQVRAEILPGAGHDLLVAQIGEVNGRVLDFLGQA